MTKQETRITQRTRKYTKKIHFSFINLKEKCIYNITNSAVHSPKEPSLETTETTTNKGDEKEQTTTEATTASSPSTKAVNILLAERIEQ